MASFVVSTKNTTDPDVIELRVTMGLGVTEEYYAPASVLTDDKLILNLVRLSKLGAGLVPIKPK